MFVKVVIRCYTAEIMRSSALSAEGLTQLPVEGVVEMRKLLTPAECAELAPPPGVNWITEEPNDTTGRSWSRTPEYALGSPEITAIPALESFLIDFRAVIQLRAAEADIPELRGWGKAPLSAHPSELLGLCRVLYGAKWHRTPANHQIGWHSDNKFDQAAKKGGVWAVGLMTAISLTQHGGKYEHVPAGTETIPGTSIPSDRSKVQSIEDIKQGDGVGFGTARNRRGRLWTGSYPLHRFIADEPEPTDDEDVSRDSLIVMFHFIFDRGIADLSLSGVARSARARLRRSLGDHEPHLSKPSYLFG